MPVSFKLNYEAKIVECKAWGILSDQDLLECQDLINADSDFSPDYNQLYDFLKVSICGVTSAGIKLMANRNMFGQGSRRAFVIKSESLELYGMMRMYGLLTEKDTDRLILIKDHIEKAESWLNIPFIHS